MTPAMEPDAALHQPTTAKRPNIDFVTDRLATGGDLHPDPAMAAEELDTLVAAGITHVVDVRIEWNDEDLVARHAPELTYIHLGIDDAGQRVPDEWFDQGVAAASNALAQPSSKVLTHCHMGINRGPSLAFAVLLWDGWDPVEALDAIRRARPIAAIGYAEDALRHFHVRAAVPLAQREENWHRMRTWFRENQIDVANIIRGIRAAEGTVYRGPAG